MAIVVRTKRNGINTFQVKVKDSSGQWFPTASFGLIEQAKAEEARLIGMKRKGALAISKDAKTVMVDEYWEVWSIENRSDVSDGWKISQDQMYRDYILPVIGKLTLISVGPPEIGKVLNRAKDLGLGDQTRKHIYSLLRKMFQDAVEYYEMLVANPVKPKFHRPKVGERKRNFLLPAQAWQLLEASQDTYLGPAIWLQTLAALRPSEVQALQGKSVHFDLNQILVCRAYNTKTKCFQNYPKQDDWDYVPMPPELSSYLKSLKRGPDDFVATGPKGKDQMLSYETYLHGLRRFCKKIGVLTVTPHELRHTCTEIYMQAGASSEDIRRLLNHQSLSATKHYIHRTDERLNRISGNLSIPLSVSRMDRVSQIVSHLGNKRRSAISTGEAESN